MEHSCGADRIGLRIEVDRSEKTVDEGPITPPARALGATARNEFNLNPHISKHHREQWLSPFAPKSKGAMPELRGHLDEVLRKDQ
jgi:hypothetical protein